MGQPLKRQRKRRTLRKCDSFKRGKCAECEDNEAARIDCDMKKNRKKKDDIE